MDQHGFDDLAKGIARTRSRRGALRASLGAAAATALAAVGFGGEAADAKKKRCKPKPILAACSSTSQCCKDKTGRVCGSTDCVGFPLQSCCKPAGGRCSVDCDCCGATSRCVGGFCATL
jgi:hypothetical protein